MWCFGRAAVIEGDQGAAAVVQIVEQTFYGCKRWFSRCRLLLRSQD
jgi:hypothetical protein